MMIIALAINENNYYIICYKICINHDFPIKSYAFVVLNMLRYLQH